MTEAKLAADWWANRPMRGPWRKLKERHAWMAERVVGEHPSSVLEFGCAAGANLLAVREADSTITSVGTDINETSTKYGRDRWGLDLRTEPLSAFGDDSFDLAFTVSVLDHIPAPDVDEYIIELCRIAPTLLLLEPYVGSEGKVDAETTTGTSPYSYSHEYPRRLRALGMAVSIERHPLSDWGLGPHYRLYTARRR